MRMLALLATSKGDLLDTTLIEVSGLLMEWTLGEFIKLHNFIDEKGSPASEVTFEWSTGIQLPRC